MGAKRRTVGLDVGGTNLKAIVIEGDNAPRTLHSETLPTPRRDGRVDTDALVTYGTSLKEEWGAERMGVAVAGVSNGRGIVQRAVNLGWTNEPVGPSFERNLRIPVTVINDGQAAALAEGVLGNAAVVRDLFVVVIGTGIAGAHFVDGRVRYGSSGQAGEVGHLVVERDGETCSCGQHGCLEVYASGAGITRRYGALTGDHASPEYVFSQARQRDVHAMQVVEQARNAIAVAVVAVSVMIDPEAVVFSGGVIAGADVLLGSLDSAVAERSTFHRIPVIEVSSFPSQAGALGAAIAGLEDSGL